MWDKGLTDAAGTLLDAARWYSAAADTSQDSAPGMVPQLTAKRNVFALAHVLLTKGTRCTPEVYDCATVQ